MLTAVMHLRGVAAGILVLSEEGGGHEVAENQPSPLELDPSELIWGGASFLVFAILMRYVLYPRLRKSMDARYHGIRTAHEQADAARQGARAEVADYEAQLAAVKAEAAVKVDAARSTLEAERQQQVAALNARLAEQRAAAAAQAEAARAAVRDQIHAAVADVAGLAGELATGKRPSSDMVSRVVSEVMAR